MKEIEFMAFEPVLGVLPVVSIDFKNRIVVLENDRAEYTLNLENVKLMRYTGIRDKYGKKIFEDSIIRDFCDLRLSDEDEPVHIDNTIVVAFDSWEDGSLGWNICEWMSDHYTVIGNIHENPRLAEYPK